MSSRSGMSPHLEGLARMINASRWMLDLEPDWDGQGGAPCSLATWKRARNLLLGGVADYEAGTGKSVPYPTFKNGPDGSIDIFWETSDCTLLLNVPAGADAPVSYQGCSRDGTQLEGALLLADWPEWFPILMELLFG